MKTILTTIGTLAGSALIAIALAQPASAGPVSAGGPITDVVGTYRIVEANDVAGPWHIATAGEGPDGSGIRLQPGQYVQVDGDGSSCLLWTTQQRHNSARDHFAECRDTDVQVPTQARTA